MANSPEHKVQVSIVKWLRIVMPMCMVQHSRNEVMKRGSTGMREVVKAKAGGMMPGFPDLICLPYASVGPFFLEVKSARGSTSSTQKQVHEMLRERGYKVAVVKTIDDVRDFLKTENIGFNEVQL